MNEDQYKNFKKDGVENQARLDQAMVEQSWIAREMSQDRKINLQTQKYFLYSLWITGFAVVIDIIFRLSNK